MRNRFDTKKCPIEMPGNHLQRERSVWLVLKSILADAHKGLITEIESAESKMNSVHEGRTEQKNNAETVLAEKAARIASTVKAYAIINNDMNLAENNDWTVSKLLKMADLEKLNRIKSIRDDAKANEAGLADYGITAEDLTDLDSFLTTYESFFTEKGIAFGERSATRKEMTELFEKINNILRNRIDLIMEIFAAEETDFYNRYQHAKTPVDYGARHEPEPETTTAEEG